MVRTPHHLAPGAKIRLLVWVVTVTTRPAAATTSNAAAEADSASFATAAATAFKDEVLVWLDLDLLDAEIHI